MTKVFTNGCFDIIHAGHCKLLRYAASLGDKLIVGINSDASIKKLKGDSRPYNKEENRKYVLECFSFIDEVIIFNEQTPYELMLKVKPDIIVKGGDYTPETIIGNDLAKVKIFPLEKGLSTTKSYEQIISNR